VELWKYRNYGREAKIKVMGLSPPKPPTQPSYAYVGVTI